MSSKLETIIAAIQLYMEDAVHLLCEIRSVVPHANTPCNINNTGTIALRCHIICCNALHDNIVYSCITVANEI